VVTADGAQTDEQQPDHRSGPRRRGDELQAAIFEAALAELAEVGYGRLTMDQVARRAHTGKTSLYRRWPTRADLVAEAVRAQGELGPFAVPDSGDLRADLLALLRRLATGLGGQFGDVLRGLTGELDNLSPDFRVMREWAIGLRENYLVEFLQRAADRGQVRSDAVNPRIATLGPALVVNHFLLQGAPIPDEVVVEIVDQVVLPLLRP
jgi:AcrR family transcriptional regulator